MSSTGAVTQTPVALTIAGSDSGGGAGIQADIKTFSALGVYGCSVITALTAQNTHGVQGILNVDPEFVNQQLDSVFSDLYIKAVKVGMLSRPEVISTVAQALEKYKPPYVVIDPVMVATGGGVLLPSSAIETLKTELFPKASLITPNLHEAASLLNCDVPESEEEMKNMIEPLLNFGSSAVILKGGHMSNDRGKAVDFYHDRNKLYHLESDWVNTDNTHGTGCTFASAITALLARGYTMNEAVFKAKNYIFGAIAHAADQLNIGHGRGPVHHFFKHW